jgi:concentrative nucleoside transporter, CNT family
MEKLSALLGIGVIVFVSFLLSRHKRRIRWRSVGLGLCLQVSFAIAILGIPSLGVPGVLRVVFDILNAFVTAMVSFTNEGSKFLFGPLAEIKDPWGFVFAFRALPTIVFFSAVMSGLYYLGVLQRVVRFFAFIMQKTMRTSGAETLSASANIFIGQTEAPLFVKPYIPRMTESEVFCLMVGGMATIAAGVEGAYVSMLKDRIPDIAGHLLTASVMGAIGGLVISKIIIPETEEPVTAGSVKLLGPEDGRENAVADVNVLEAISRGASDGIQLAMNVGAMLVVFISLIAILDAGLMKFSEVLSLSTPLNFSSAMGFLLKPLAWLIGIPWTEAGEVGSLLGKKIVLNEFVAYLSLSEVGTRLSDRAVLISTYALCGFANISSIGIQIGGIGVLAGRNKSTIARLGLLAVVGGTFACCLSACIAALLF